MTDSIGPCDKFCAVMSECEARGEEIIRLNGRIAALEGALLEARRRDLRYYGVIHDDKWAYDGPIGAYIGEILEKIMEASETASSSL